MKSGQPVEPTHYENVTVLIADIVSFTALSSKSSANQIVTLLNRLYSEMDNVLDRYEDVYKLETIGDAYCIVAGLNNRERSVRENAKDVIECALSFIEIVQKLDMSDQVQDKIEIRVGVHTGPAVGGVANPSMPKFSLFGDTITTTGLLEQTSRKMHVHISGATHELIQDAFETDVSESIAVDCGPQKGKKKVASYWVVGKKRGAGGSSGAGAIGLSSIGGSSAYSHGSSGAEREKGGYTVGGGSGGDGGSRAVPSILTTSADGAQGKDRGARQVSIQGMPFSRLNKNMQ
ncbi:adenylate and guanylate cyclase catalytic domain-containing protein [Zopfochytrium polystomum]|nr:adenylate and guanylate cyclase catalytic domain-containing protein [Zopfochytrium polystomum]